MGHPLFEMTSVAPTPPLVVEWVWMATPTTGTMNLPALVFSPPSGSPSPSTYCKGSQQGVMEVPEEPPSVDGVLPTHRPLDEIGKDNLHLSLFSFSSLLILALMSCAGDSLGGWSSRLVP